MISRRLRDRLATATSIAVLAALAAGTWLLADRASRQAAPAEEPATRHEPDWFVEGFGLTRLGDTGQGAWRITARRMEHFPDDDTIEFDAPRIVSIDPARPRTIIDATRARSFVRDDRTLLEGDVRIVRAGSGGAPDLRVTTDRLDVLQSREIARTSRPVRIEQGTSSLTGVGMEFDNAAHRLQVLSQVRGAWQRDASPAR